jgi:hypothetical protein
MASTAASITIRRRWLEQEVSRAVRSYLEHRYPTLLPTTRSAAFAPTSSSTHTPAAVGRNGAASLLRRSTTARTAAAAATSSRLDLVTRLARLHGYHRVAAAETRPVVLLAEGVLARPPSSRFRTSSHDTLWAKPLSPGDDGSYAGEFGMTAGAASSSASSTTTTTTRPLPPMVEEDIKIYRILENNTEAVLQKWQGRWRDWLHQRVVRPLTRVQTQLARGAALLTSSSSSSPNKYLSFASSLPDETSTDLEKDRGDDNPEQQPHVVLSIHHPTAHLQLITHVEPRHYTLLLPYDLGHKTASTLIQVSLVVFGAVPLAYRSLNFVWAYPALANTVAASVVVTISYGLWSSRSVARTNQALGIHKALLARVVAQDEAVLVYLREAAVTSLTHHVLARYDHREGASSSSRSLDLHVPNSKHPRHTTTDTADPEDMTTLADHLVHQVGLLSETGVAYALDEAYSNVQRWNVQGWKLDTPSKLQPES